MGNIFSVSYFSGNNEIKFKLMKIIIYSIEDFERSYFLNANKMKHEFTQAVEALTPGTEDLVIVKK